MHFKLKIELEDDISTCKDKLSTINRERLPFLNNVLNKFKIKHYKNLERPWKNLNKLSASLVELPNAQTQ